MDAENQIVTANNQISAAEGAPEPARRGKGRPRFPIDRRSAIGRRVAAFERALVAAVLKANGKSKGQPRPLAAEQRKDIRLACAYEALCTRLEQAMLVGEILDTRALDEATKQRNHLVYRLTEARW